MNGREAGTSVGHRAPQEIEINTHTPKDKREEKKQRQQKPTQERQKCCLSTEACKLYKQIQWPLTSEKPYKVNSQLQVKSYKQYF